MRRWITWAVAWGAAGGLWAVGIPAAGAPAAVDAAKCQIASQAFEAVNTRIDGLLSIQYQVERKTMSKGVTLVEKWTSIRASSGLLKIDYRQPERRVFMADGKTFTEYLPAARAALQIPMAGNNPLAQERIASILQRLAVDGLRVGQYGKLLEHLASVDVTPGEFPVLTAEGRDPRYRIRIDLERKALLSFEKWDRKERLEQSIQAESFREVATGLWLPAKVRTVLLEEHELSERETTLSGIRVNFSISEKEMDFTLPEDVPIKAFDSI